MQKQSNIQHPSSSNKINNVPKNNKTESSQTESDAESVRQKYKSKAQNNSIVRDSKKSQIKNIQESSFKITDFFGSLDDITRQNLQSHMITDDQSSTNKALILSKQKQNLEHRLKHSLQLLEEMEKKSKHQNLYRQNLEKKFDLQQQKLLENLPKIVFELEQKTLREEYQQMMEMKNNIGYLRSSSSQKLSDWIDGQKLQKIKQKIQQYKQEVFNVENYKNQLKQDKRKSKVNHQNYENQVNDCKHRLTVINRKLDMARKTLERYEKQKVEIVLVDRKFKEMKNCYFSIANFETSIEAWPVLNQQYKILSLIGKGGFAEVYKAYDILNFRYVACKVQMMDRNWPENVRQAFIKYTQRENKVFSSLHHKNIVKYYETVFVDHYTTCTVLEYCEGKDLDYLINVEKKISEKQARQIIEKLLDVLKYLNQREQKIIHYDLKPANILFDEYDEIKVTDFGLSKIIDNGQSKIQFTSFGCGTYNYLPPECLVNQENQMISPKVDIWSTAVIFYCLLYGQKPFKKQARNNDVNVIEEFKRKKIVFPDQPHVSEKSQNFILACLNANESERPDIFEAIKLFNN